MANERRLISADEIEKLFYAQIEHGATDLMDAFDDALQDCWPVDAVEVCFCKDCKYWDPISYGHRTDGFCLCLHKYHDAEKPGTEGDFYCAYGEQRSGTQPQREDV